MSSVLSIPEECRRQAGLCKSLGSILYTHLLSRCADVYEAGGSVRDLLEPHEKDDMASAAHLRKSVAGAATVVFHSVVWPYISESERQRIITMIEEAGKHASAEAPIAWLRMEAINNTFEIRLRIYSRFNEQIIATSLPHAPSVQWLLKSH